MSGRHNGDAGQGEAGAPTRSDSDPSLDADLRNPEGESGRVSALISRQGQVVALESRKTAPKVRAPSGLAGREHLASFRELRTRLMSMAATSGLTHFTTLVASVSPKAGASFVARNLAAAFTLEERRVAILVDCNLRHPGQHVALGLGDVEGGLFDYLERPHGHVEQLIHQTCVPALHLIPAGNPPRIPREYFSSQAMRMVMTALRQPSCYVFIDSPPTKTAPDAQILSGLADFVILVVGYGRDTPEDIAKASALFERTKFAGVVFNERP